MLALTWRSLLWCALPCVVVADLASLLLLPLQGRMFTCKWVPISSFCKWLYCLLMATRSHSRISALQDGQMEHAHAMQIEHGHYQGHEGHHEHHHHEHHHQEDPTMYKQE